MAVQQPSLEEIGERIKSVFADVGHDVAAVYLFGSTARGTRRPASDVDLGLLFRKPPTDKYSAEHFDLEAELTAAVGLPVQLVVLNDAPADLVHRVLRDGILLLQPDASARIRFEVAKRNEYFDLLPHLRRYRRFPPPR
jgi:predicted nucleotidyltransferase